MDQLPVIDVGPLVGRGGDIDEVARAIDDACRQHGFFYVVGHGVDDELQRTLEVQARALFALPESAKAEVAMSRGGPAWRGWFPLGGELTAGVPDGKEGFYVGAELGHDHPLVRAGTPLHGPNLFPLELPELRRVVLEYLDSMTELGHALMRGIALGMGLPADWFREHLTGDPIVLFRIFRYPPQVAAEPSWGVAEHTDYGLLTILRQDSTPGLEVRSPSGWIEAPPLPGSFVCNLGDMLERMTAGRYRSTAHRVRNTSDRDRLSFPFFFDPGWNAPVLDGTYGEYLLSKVGQVFPTLRDEVL